MLTQDESMVEVPFEVQYRLKNKGELAYLFGNTAKPLANTAFSSDINRRADGAIQQAADSAMREAVARYTLDELLTQDRSMINTAVASRVQQLLDRSKTPRLDAADQLFDSGILISKVSIQAVQLPDSLRSEQDEIVKATQDRDRAISEAKVYASDTVLRATATAKRLNTEAAAYKNSVLQAAAGEAARFKAVQAEYAKAPALTRQRLYLDTMQQVFQSTSKVLVDTKNNSNMLSLSLDKLLAQTQTGDLNTMAATATPATTPNSAVLLNPNTPKESVKVLSQEVAKDAAKDAGKDLAKPSTVVNPASLTSRERDARDFN
jgi:membrane protease subunit HflK